MSSVTLSIDRYEELRGKENNLARILEEEATPIYIDFHTQYRVVRKTEVITQMQAEIDYLRSRQPEKPKPRTYSFFERFKFLFTNNLPE